MVYSDLLSQSCNALGGVGKQGKKRESLFFGGRGAKDVGVIRSFLFTGCDLVLVLSE